MAKISKSKDLPKKPYPDFPLFAHQSGQWAKKIRGKMRYFGPLADPMAAVARYESQREALQLGKTPATGVGLSVADLCNQFLTYKKRRWEGEELGERSWHDYHAACKRIVRVFGRGTSVASLTPDDFDGLRADITKTRGPTALSTEVARIRSVFKYAIDFEKIAAPVRMGKHFRGATKKAKREARNNRPQRYLEPHEVRTLIAEATPQLRAYILLGINCGFGQTDLAKLPKKLIHLESGWIKYPRPKTGVTRECPLWPETVKALSVILPKRPTALDPAHEPLAFLTERHKPLVHVTEKTGSPSDSVAQSFGKLMRKLGIKRMGVNFYAIRHTFETVASETKDQAAIDVIMGHAEESDDMSAAYREFVSRERLLAVTDYIRSWLGLENSPIFADGSPVL